MSDITNKELLEIMSSQFNKFNNELELIAAQVGKLTTKVDGISKDLSIFKSDTEERFNKIDNRLMTIENEHGSKIDALLDGYKHIAEVQEEIKSNVHNIKTKQDMEKLVKQLVKNIE